MSPLLRKRRYDGKVSPNKLIPDSSGERTCEESASLLTVQLVRTRRDGYSDPEVYQCSLESSKT